MASARSLTLHARTLRGTQLRWFVSDQANFDIDGQWPEQMAELSEQRDKQSFTSIGRLPYDREG